MKKFLGIVLSAVMMFSGLGINTVLAGSSNSVTRTPIVSEDSVLMGNGVPVYLQIQPRSEVVSGDSIILTIENGKFNRALVEQDPITGDPNFDKVNSSLNIAVNGKSVNPFIFHSNKTGATYETIENAWNIYPDKDTALIYYVGNENSRKLPYSFNWISETELEVKLFPISDLKVNQNNSAGDVTDGTPIYSIALPITTEGSKAGNIEITIDDNDSSITSSGHICGKIEGEDLDDDKNFAGDVNKDGKVDRTDLLTLAKYFAGL